MKPTAHLLKQCRKGRREAQSRLYRDCFPLLMGVCLRYVSNRDDAAAALNLGFYKILENLHRYSERIPFEAWARRIMINTLIDEYRRQRKYKETIIPTDWEESAWEGEQVDYNLAEQQLEVEEIEALIRKLPDMTRQVFNLYVLDGYTHKEIAEQARISIGTSKWHLSHARSRMKEMLKEYMNELRNGYGSQCAKAGSVSPKETGRPKRTL